MPPQNAPVLPPTDACERYEQARQKPVMRESSYRSASLRMLSSLDPTHPRVLLNDV
jgi:hypothetical protein|tara:strand:- start:1272 stop:1439 length:168 start_codon:yes stop_codon:yes gene_type:complete